MGALLISVPVMIARMKDERRRRLGGAAPPIKAKWGLPSSISFLFVSPPTIDRPLIRNNEPVLQLLSTFARACRILHTGTPDTCASSNDSECHALRHLRHVHGPHHVQRLLVHFNIARRRLRLRLLQASGELQPDLSHIPPCHCRRHHHCAHRPRLTHSIEHR